MDTVISSRHQSFCPPDGRNCFSTMFVPRTSHMRASDQGPRRRLACQHNPQREQHQSPVLCQSPQRERPDRGVRDRRCRGRRKCMSPRRRRSRGRLGNTKQDPSSVLSVPIIRSTVAEGDESVHTTFYFDVDRGVVEVADMRTPVLNSFGIAQMVMIDLDVLDVRIHGEKGTIEISLCIMGSGHPVS